MTPGVQLLPFCFLRAEVGWEGRSCETSLVEEVPVKESSLMSPSSDLLETGGGASSTGRVFKTTKNCSRDFMFRNEGFYRSSRTTEFFRSCV